MKFLCIDQAITKFGISIFEDDKLIYYKQMDLSKLKFENTEEKINTVKKIMKAYIEKNEIALVVLEDIFLQATKGFYKNYSSFKKLAMLLGVLVDTLHENKILYQLVKPSEWRSTCKIKGKDRDVKKDNAKKFVSNMYGLDVPEDCAEAICMGYHTHRRIVPKIKKT